MKDYKSFQENSPWLLEFIIASNYQTGSEEIYTNKFAKSFSIRLIVEKLEKLFYMYETLQMRLKQSLLDYLYKNPQTIDTYQLPTIKQMAYTADQLKKSLIENDGLAGLKLNFISDQNEISFIMCVNRKLMRTMGSYTTHSMYVNNGRYLCTKTPLATSHASSKEFHKVIRSFWRMIWNEQIHTLASIAIPTLLFYFPSQLSEIFIICYFFFIHGSFEIFFVEIKIKYFGIEIFEIKLVRNFFNNFEILIRKSETFEIFVFSDKNFEIIKKISKISNVSICWETNFSDENTY